MAQRETIITHNGKEYLAEICSVRETFLGIEDHGLFAAILELEGQSWGTHFHFSVLDGNPRESLGERTPTAYGMFVLKEILNTLGVTSWEKVKWQKLFLLRDKVTDMPQGIAHLEDEDKILIVEDLKDLYESKFA